MSTTPTPSIVNKAKRLARDGAGRRGRRVEATRGTGRPASLVVLVSRQLTPKRESGGPPSPGAAIAAGLIAGAV
jgi:hypothetical protein